MASTKKVPMPRKTQDIETAWSSHPDKIRKFLDQHPDYEQLCDEVAYILRKRLEEKSIEIALVSQRAKTLNSFLDKMLRKKYDDPFQEIEDFAGVRIVCLYVGDFDQIEQIIQSEFEVIERVDKFTEKEADQFGYGAIHYIARLGKKTLGARYEDLKDLKCEIQLRTVLQDAWAIIDHHLVYKRESDVPKLLLRKLNSLAGLFETADDQFNRLRDERQDYIDKLQRTSKDLPTFLKTEINRDSFVLYLEWRFSGMKLEGFDGQLDFLLNAIDNSMYTNLESLEAAISPVFPRLEEIMAYLPRRYDSGVLRFGALLSIVDNKYRINNFTDGWIEAITIAAAELDLEKTKAKERQRRKQK